MRKVGGDIAKVISQIGGDTDAARINMRTHQVRDRYRKAIESVYRESAALHLAHTNNVIITNKDGVKTLIVYVDDSLFAAELNAQRELIKLYLLELFGEEIDEFQIKTSRWKKYRESHPYIDKEEKMTENGQESVPLNAQEREYVLKTVSRIEDKKLRESLQKAMTADLERKKGEKVSSSSKNGK